MSTLAAPPERAGPTDPVRSDPPAGHCLIATAIGALTLAGGLVAVAFLTAGGVDQDSATAGNTWTEVALTVLGAAAVVTVLIAGARGRRWGGATVALMAALAVLTALSITWSVLPDSSWLAADQLLAYFAVFAAAVGLARLLPARWPVVLGSIMLLAVALSGWALLVKVFPSTLAPGNSLGRLQAPFGYWNAVGVSGALGVPVALWAGSRRGRGRRLAGWTVPALTLMLSAVILSYSRSADAMAAIGIIGWLVFAPLRLRSAAVLALGTLGAAAISGWALATPGLTGDNVALAAQDAAGHTFGWVLLAVLIATSVGGLGMARAMDRVTVERPLRRRIGTILLALVGLALVAGVLGVAASSRGLTGQVTHAWHTLTNPAGGNVGDESGRVLQFGSSRPLYWREGLDVGEHALLKGVGALGFATARLRYTTDTARVDEAHSYLIQTFADLGLLGIAVTLALLVAWGAAAVRPLGLRIRGEALTADARAERHGSLALLLIVVAFGVQSALDWTWYFPGVAVPALLCAGWLAGRGPLLAPIGRRAERRSLLDRPGVAATAVGLVALALLGAWLQWQPLRSAQQLAASEEATTNARAFADARASINSDPLALLPRLQLASLYESVKQPATARAQLAHATRIQPQNAEAWLALASFDVAHGSPRIAVADIDRLIPLDRVVDPTTKAALTVLIEAKQAIAAKPAAGSGGSSS